MTRFWTGFGLALLAGVISAPRGHASVLCKTKKGGLLVRESCKPKEVTLDASQTTTLGLRGPQGETGLTGPIGPQGPAGAPGPPGSGVPGSALAVVDTTGQEVGAVAGAFFGQYGSSAGATVVRQMTLPGGAQPEWVAFSITGAGFGASEYGTEFVYAAPNCTGTQYFECEYGSCEPANALFRSLHPEPDGRTAYFARGSEQVTQQYYRVDSTNAPTPTDASNACTNPLSSFQAPGVVISGPSPCNQGFVSYCTQCCRPICVRSRLDPGCTAQATVGAPARSFDLSSLGLVTPFRLHR